MRTYHTCVSLWLPIPAVRNSGGQRTISASPIEIGNEIEILVECGLRLFINDAENLIDGSIPLTNGDFRIESIREGYAQLSFIKEVSFVSS
jgi:hypothetical protein